MQRCLLRPLVVSVAANAAAATPYDAGCGISAEVADSIDAALAASSGGGYLKVDRARLAESLEAWVFVVADIPESSDHDLQGPYFGAPRGFGRSTGVLTWHNSD